MKHREVRPMDNVRRRSGNKEQMVRRNVRSVCFVIVTAFLFLAVGAYGYKDVDVTAALTARQCLSCDLSGAKLAGADLSYVSLVNSNLAKTNLKRANLRGTNLIATNLYKANLAGADLTLAALGNANLTKAKLSGATLNSTNLSGANLTGATWINGATCKEGSIGYCKQ